MRILIITQAVDENDHVLGFFVGWIRRLAERVSSVHVLTQSQGSHRLNASVRVHSLGKERGAGRLSRQLQLQGQLARILLLDRSVDVVLCHMCPEYALAAYPLARVAGVPLFLWYTHGQGSGRLRLAQRAVRRVLTASAESYPFPSPKVVATGHGIDTGQFRPRERPPNHRRVVLSLGRLSPIKAHEVPIRALSLLVRQREMRDVELRIVGGVPMPSQRVYLEELKRIVAGEGLEPHVVFAGGVPHAEVEQHLAAADVVVSASRTGSLDKAPLESLACGRLAVVSDAAFRDEVRGYEDLLTFRPGDCVDLADRLSAILGADRGRVEAIASDLRRRVAERHDLNRLVGRMLEVFRDAGPAGEVSRGG